MKSFCRIFVASLLAGGVAVPALAQNEADATATSTVTIVRPITLTKNTDLQFGTIVRPVSGDATITIDETTGNRTIGSGAFGVTSTTGRATYTVGGEGGYGFSIDVDDTVDMTGAGDPIEVTLVATAASGTLSGSFPSAGTATFGVGGSFELGNAQASGAYSGTFSTTVAYN